MIERMNDGLRSMGFNPIYFFTLVALVNAAYLIQTNTPDRQRQLWQQFYVWSAVATAGALSLLSVLMLLGVVKV